MTVQEREFRNARPLRKARPGRPRKYKSDAHKMRAHPQQRPPGPSGRPSARSGRSRRRRR